MNRQAFPSILLSVAIVGFFAVVLRQRDPEPGRPAKEAPARKGDSVGTAAPVILRGDQEISRGGPVEKVSQRSGGDRGVRAASLGVPSRSTSGVSARSDSIRATGPDLVAARTSTARDAGVRVARAPFTIVGAGESIRDVARRVYGTPEEADWLWRSNRDVVGEPGGSLSPGTVLRTPARTRR